MYICSTLARRRSSLSGPRVGAEEDGCAEVSSVEVNLSISSSISPPSSSTRSCGIVCTPSFGAFDVSCALSHCMCTNGIVPLNDYETTQKFESCLRN